MPLCGRSKDPTRVRSPRQLPTDHDYAARPANIRLINRRDSFLDRYPRRLRYRKKEKPALVVDWSFHIRGAGLLRPPTTSPQIQSFAPQRTPLRENIFAFFQQTRYPLRFVFSELQTPITSYISANCPNVNSSARALPAILHFSNAAPTRSPSATPRKLFRNVFLFCPKQVCTNSRNRPSSAIPNPARSPGNSILTKAEVTFGGGRNAPAGIRNSISGRA